MGKEKPVPKGKKLFDKVQQILNEEEAELKTMKELLKKRPKLFHFEGDLREYYAKMEEWFKEFEKVVAVIIAELQDRLKNYKKEQKRLKREESDTIENRIAWNWIDGRRRELYEFLVMLGVKEKGVKVICRHCSEASE